jgi:tetratricopeptide (TPR) repeat protein
MRAMAMDRKVTTYEFPGGVMKKPTIQRSEAMPAALPRPWDQMWKHALLAGLATLAMMLVPMLDAQTPRPLIDVEHYNIGVEVDLPTQSLEAVTEVRFVPREEIQSATFELHNALDVKSVVSDDGVELSVSRDRHDFTVHVIFREPQPSGKPVNLTFLYDGRLVGAEDSPVQGISLASIEADRAYLLYPARWFPVNGYSADRFTANINVTTASNLKVIASGFSTRETTPDKVVYSYQFGQASFPGSIAIVSGELDRLESEGVTTEVAFRNATPELKQAYADAVGQMIRFHSEKFGAPYASSLVLVETGEFAPASYAAPGIVFLSPWGVGQSVNRRLLGTEVAHQWWRTLVSPGNRNHLWLDLGGALYAAALEIEANLGAADYQAQIDDIRIEALTYTDIPVLQASRLPDFSPELNALAGAKGAMVLHMLRWTLGDEAFFAAARQFVEKFAWQSATTDDFRMVAEAASGKGLQPFFIQWTENSSTPEFTQEYTIYRMGGGEGFRILGKVAQDLDTFSMPVELKIETEGEPEFKTVEVSGVSSDYVVETFGKPRRVVLDPNHRILRYDGNTHVLVAIRKGEQLVELGYYPEALAEYQKALDINRYSSLAHYRIGDVFFQQGNYQSAANEFRESLNGDQEPAWTEVWAHINLGMIFDITGQRERAVNEYQLAIRTRDDTQGAQDVARKYLESPYKRPRRQETIY